MAMLPKNMNEVSIRLLDRSDSALIKEIASRQATNWFHDAKYILDGYIEPSFSGGFPYVYVALDSNNHLVGQIFLVIDDNTSLGIKDQPWITALFVKEEFRNKGIARMLMKVCEDKCLEMGHSRLYLDTAQAAGYYRHIGGWDEIGKDFWRAGNKEVVVMSKAL